MLILANWSKQYNTFLNCTIFRIFAHYIVYAYCNLYWNLRAMIRINSGTNDCFSLIHSTVHIVLMRYGYIPRRVEGFPNVTTVFVWHSFRFCQFFPHYTKCMITSKAKINIFWNVFITPSVPSGPLYLKKFHKTLILIFELIVQPQKLKSTFF